jgi:hypothetical protein
MIPPETVPGIMGVGMKESSGGVVWYIWYTVRTLVNTIIYTHPGQ